MCSTLQMPLTGSQVVSRHVTSADERSLTKALESQQKKRFKSSAPTWRYCKGSINMQQSKHTL